MSIPLTKQRFFKLLRTTSKRTPLFFIASCIVMLSISFHPGPLAFAQQKPTPPLSPLVLTTSGASSLSPTDQTVFDQLGQEKALPRHLTDGDEYTLPITALLAQGKALFSAPWTNQDGGGRPLTNGVGTPLVDASSPLVFPHNFNRVSGPDANACSGCHNLPYGIAGGGGDIVANVFVLAQRFDFVTFDRPSSEILRSTLNEQAHPVTLQTVGNSRATVGMFGAGYLEMVARQMTADLQTIRDSMTPGQIKPLQSKGVSFGTLQRNLDGSWDTSKVEGLPPNSLTSKSADDPPNLCIRIFHQAGAVASLREFSNTAFNHHHGIQSTERFGIDQDPDGDHVVNELTRADITAVTLYQAAMAVPGRVIPRNQIIEDAVWQGEQTFTAIGCSSCHLAQLPLDKEGWLFTEPNPFNPPGNLRVGEAPSVTMDLSSDELPQPRLKPVAGVVYVPAYTDFKLHNITADLADPNVEGLKMQVPRGSDDFFAGNAYFVTKRLWGAANEPPYFHHGLYTTLRDATLAHSGEALASRQAFEQLSDYKQKAVIEFLKSLQILPPGTKALVIDETGAPRAWPPARLNSH